MSKKENFRAEQRIKKLHYDSDKERKAERKKTRRTNKQFTKKQFTKNSNQNEWLCNTTCDSVSKHYHTTCEKND